MQASGGITKSEGAIVANASAILLDWDGCVALADTPSEAAIDFIRRHHERIAILSNNSTMLPADVSAILSRFGVTIPAERIFLAGAEAIASAARHAPASTLILGDSRMKAYARALGVSLEREHASLVVLLRDRRFSYARLERAANALRNGGRLIVANPDLVHPGPKGVVVPETGALLAALLSCVSISTIDIEIIGKPAPRLFLKACEALGAAPESAIMIGDNFETDIRGAEALGIRSVLVSSTRSLSLLTPPDSSAAA